MDAIFNPDETAGDASINATQWLLDAVSQIDESLGHGYAAKHPAIISGFLTAAATSYHADRTVDAAELIASALLALATERVSHG
jgi:hypothetical protein